MTTITEWEFTADVASQINEILRDRSDLPFSSAHCEQRGSGSSKRRDLTLNNRSNKPILTGEVKLPDKRDGRSPIAESLVNDAHAKANSIGVAHFFTWNVNNCVLWKTFEQDKRITERYVEFFDALPAPIRHSDELSQPRVREQVRKFLVHFLEQCAAIFDGKRPMLLLPLDEKFIKVWELALFPLIIETLAAIHARYDKDKKFHLQLDKWMRDEQGWTLSKDEEIIRENLERASKFSCYVLANKIVFYKALRRQFPQMKDLHIGAKIKTGAQLRKLLDEHFQHATEETLDYETVFQTDFGDTLPLLNDAAVESWRDLIADTDKFDFTHINYEVIGQIFERMLNTSERHKFGQHYTRSEIVDLINAFCIRDANATVLDPSCGGGTFLVRAYQRKSDLANGKLSHQEIVNQLYGTDISAYPVHLTTINLATRDLKEGANYPLVARRDFLKLNVGDKIFRIPQDDEIELAPMPKVNAIVGNPPYVRQEKINEYYGGAYKKFLQDAVRDDAPDAVLSGRSDILCYFFTHGFAFLEDEGYMGLLTSSNWLDTAYGFQLQKFLLDNFEIVAIFESNCEPWFTGARVTTAATILKRQKDATKRAANNVKFVWLKQPIADFLTYVKTEDDRRQTFEDLRRRIENLTTEEETASWRVRVVGQAALYEAGCLPFAVSEDEEDDAESANDDATDDVADWRRGQATFPEHDDQPFLRGQSSRREYTGYKWGIYLRAPEIFSKLLARGGERFVPLGQIAEVRFGVKSGCDAFFFPRDITDEALAQDLNEREFKERYGISRNETNKIRIVHAGDDSLHLIEAKYLEPEVHSLMEIGSVEINSKNLARKILLVSTPKERLKDTYVLKYIKWGEKERFPERSTIQSRISEDRNWYDLAGERRADLILPKLQQYRHIACINSQNHLNNSSLLSVFVSKSNAKILCAILNSTIVALSKQFFARMHGREGSLQLDVYSAQMMLVPDPRQATAKVRKRLESALDSMRRRQALQLVDVDSHDVKNWTGELALADRQQLDDAVLELLGITDTEERAALRDELYAEITKLYRQIRIAERKMQKHRSESARKGKQTAHSIAEEIWEELAPQPSFQTPLDFIPSKTRTEEITLPVGRARIVKQDLLQPDGVQIGETFIELGDADRSQFVKELSDLELHGTIRVPVTPAICQQALEDYRATTARLNEEFTAHAATFIADETMQERVVKELWRKMKK